MRRILRGVFHLVMAVTLVFGCCIMIFWPINVTVGSLFLTYHRLEPTQIKRADGPWLKYSRYYLDVMGGGVTFTAAPYRESNSVTDDTGTPPSGVIHESKVDVTAGLLETVWDTPIGSPSNAIGGTYSNSWDFQFFSPLWILAVPPVLCGLLWLLFFVALPRRNRKFRVLTGYCLQCGTNLTAAEDDTCPECGAARPLVTLSTGQQ